jgi:hypothetical protein
MNATIAITGIQLTATNLGLPESADWYAWYEERDLQASGGAVKSVEGEQEESSQGALVLSGNALQLVSGQESQSDIGGAQANGDSQTELQGATAEFSIGTVQTSVITPVSVSVSITGIALNVTLGNVIASEVSAEILRLSGNPIVYSFESTNAITKISTIEAKITASKIVALGTIIQNSIVSLQSVGAVMQSPTLEANGVLDISEEELVLFLMAA